MLFLTIFQNYILWHYSRAYLEILHVWSNFIWFIIHYFSMPQLLRSWFSPWKRIVEERGDLWSFENLAGYIIIGFFSRLIGFILRTTVLVSGLVVLLLTICVGLITYLLWIAIPFFIFALFYVGISFLFT